MENQLIEKESKTKYVILIGVLLVVMVVYFYSAIQTFFRGIVLISPLQWIISNWGFSVWVILIVIILIRYSLSEIMRGE